MTCGVERETARRKAIRPVSVQGGRAYNRCCGSGEKCKVLDEIRSQDALPSREEKITVVEEDGGGDAPTHQQTCRAGFRLFRLDHNGHSLTFVSGLPCMLAESVQ
jgi:hypothetical protein